MDKLTKLKEELKTIRKTCKKLVDDLEECGCGYMEEELSNWMDRIEDIQEEISRLKKKDKLKVTTNKMGKIEIRQGKKLVGVQG